MNLVTPSMMETLVVLAGMTAFAEDCDRIVMAKRALPPTIAPIHEAESLPPLHGE